MSASGNSGAGSSGQPGASSSAALPRNAAASASARDTFFRRWLLTPLLIAFSIGLFTFLEHFWEDRRLFVELRRIGFEWTSHLAGVEVSSSIEEELPVVLVDITDLQLTDFEGARSTDGYDPKPGYTPRAILKTIATKLARGSPAAIGFDIDLSGDPLKHNGAPPANHEDFLLTCLDISQGKWRHEGVAQPAIPVFLGVGRSAWHDNKAHWLGKNAYSSLAAGVYLASDQEVINPPAYSLVPLAFRLREKAPGKAAPPSATLELKSLSDKLVGALGEPDHRHSPPDFLKKRLFADYRTIKVKRSALGTGEIDAFYINFAPLNKLHATRLLARGLEQMPLEELQRRVAGKVVIVGDADLDRAGDKLMVPGHRRVVPGVYAHAAAVVTRHHAPLWSLYPAWYIGSHDIGYVAGALLGFAVSVIALVLCSRIAFLHDHDGRHHVAHLVLVLLGLLAVAIFLAMAWNVIWIGCIGALVGAGFDLLFLLWWAPKPKGQEPHTPKEPHTPDSPHAA